MSPQEYNARVVPIMAPCGFPEHLALPSPDSAFFVPKIKEIQRELGLKDDGACGPKTIEAIAAREYAQAKAKTPDAKLLLIGPRAVELPHSLVDVVTYLDEEGAHLGKTLSGARNDALTLGVIHYDVTNSSSSTHKVLLKRGLSTHFMIDQDGTLYQAHNPLTRVCYHAGSRANARGLGVDLNNPALRKYERSAGAPRDEVEVEVHGRKLKMLDYWQIQIQALELLMDAMQEGAGLPRRCPRDAEGKAITTTTKSWLKHKGWIGHYHITERKIDPSPLSWDVVCPNT